MTTRLVSFANSTIAVTYHGDLPAQIVDFLYRHISAIPNAPPPTLTYHLCGDEPDLLTLQRGDTLLYRGHSAAAAAILLLGDSGQALAASSQGGLLFHAAGLAQLGHGLLLPGPTGCGKSTLAAWLLSRGLAYLSDELIFVASGSVMLQGFTRPLNLKPPARSILPADLDAPLFSTPYTDLVSPACTLNTAPLIQIIFPTYQPGGSFSLRPLSPARAGLALMQCLLNARNLPDHGFAEISRLTRQAPAYQLDYGHFEQLQGWLESQP
ncbi:MAG: hypothetical protein BroJett011_45140 [Chloroflexota bacterium]|nr:MAG: hypothetical protein BroJett011_45140 [Chloroflexota bacterium]